MQAVQGRRNAEQIWQARDSYRVKSFLLGIALVALLCVVGFLAGCQDMSRSVARMTGCEDRALDVGYCHMPKPLPTAVQR